MSKIKSTVSRAAHDETEVGAHGFLQSYSLKPQRTDIFLGDTRQQQSANIITQDEYLSLSRASLQKMQMSPAHFEKSWRICVTKKKQQHSTVDT